MDLSELLDIKEKLKKGFTIIVESNTGFNYEGIREGYIREGAIGIITSLSEVVSRSYSKKLNIYEPAINYHVLVYYLKNLEISYNYFGNDDDSTSIDLIDVKKFIPPKDPNQLELIFS